MSEGSHSSTNNDQPRRMVLFAILGALLAAQVVFSAGCSDLQREISTAEDQFTLGERVYSENCAACHGQNGEGHAEVVAAPALDASEHAWHHPDGQLQQLIMEGGKTMPTFGDKLTNREAVAVIRYFQTWWAAGQLQSQQSLSRQFPIQE